MINEYDCLQKVIHIDCYKEKKLGIWLSLGLNDYIDDDNNIIIIEWPEILESIKINKIEFHFSYSNDFKSRSLIISANYKNKLVDEFK